MNYYEKHIGDYLRDAGHLSLLEHGVYNRLLDVYYTREGPIPLDQAARLIGARSESEREALAGVLDEFFHQTQAGWAHTRCDAEIARYREKTDKARKSAEARWGKQPHPPTETSAMPTNSDGNADAMRPHSERIANAVPTQCEGSAHQTPDTSNQKEQEQRALEISKRAAAAANAMIEGGVPPTRVNPSHPDLLALVVDPRATPGMFRDTAREGPGKPMQWVVRTIAGRLADAARPGKSPAANAFARTTPQEYERGALIEGRLPSWLEGESRDAAAV